MLTKNNLPPLNSLPVFIAVMKTKSYTKAAEELFMTHSAVSQSIKKLEAFLDKKLFLTEKRRLIITDLAKEYYLKIDPLITQIYKATQTIKESRSKKLSINCMTTLCANWLIPRLDILMESFENTEIQLIAIGRNVDFDYDDIDLSIEYGTEEEFNKINKYKLKDAELVLVCNNKHKNKSCSEIITNEKLIYVDDEIRINDYIQWSKHNNITIKPKQKVVFKNSIQAIKACFSGIGFFVTEKLLVEEYIKNGLLYMPKQTRYLNGKSYYLLAKDSNLSSFKKIKQLLISFLDN